MGGAGRGSGTVFYRGGIMDVFSLTEDNPWRIELWEMRWIHPQF